MGPHLNLGHAARFGLGTVSKETQDPVYGLSQLSKPVPRSSGYTILQGPGLKRKSSLNTL